MEMPTSLSDLHSIQAPPPTWTRSSCMETFTKINLLIDFMRSQMKSRDRVKLQCLQSVNKSGVYCIR